MKKQFLVGLILGVMLVVSTVLLLASYQRRNQSLLSTPNALYAQESCEKHGGLWIRVRHLHKEVCNPPTADGGQVCSDSDQCQGECFVQESLPAGSETTGVCGSFEIILGCHGYVEDGKVQPACTDG